MKCATVTIIGRPSAGKSTLVNTICEAKVSITARTPQTTRNAIKGIYTDSRGQLVFTDTPGYHTSDKQFNKRLQDVALSALEDSDIILYVIDASRQPGEEEEAIAGLLSKITKTPVICGINKADILTEIQKETATSFLQKQLPASPVLTFSAQEDTGIDELLITLFSHAPESEPLYPEETFTDQPLEFRIAEIIREKAIRLSREELPHSIFVEVSDLEYNEEESKVWVRAFINVERESQKGMVVGKGGDNIKKIRKESFKDIKKIFPDLQLTIDLRVKTQEKWRQDSGLLDKLLT
ncbi:GTPase Era [Parasphaerochaeta coccoides]|uniref:GTPase Era n=1 Tax=Parasphaerochaeta coccoides (strain ATCC BAA-1237 / DSM 17374 / SPN1) TaxID=760011 RepID=F4GIR6_PARC1|nr:GTPase Era [Parasphaerochaeta coccoides]AEC02684.1 GTP-binding protein Era-like-protein [Parasphaerochaeta coccoides DSM 17374]